MGVSTERQQSLSQIACYLFVGISTAAIELTAFVVLDAVLAGNVVAANVIAVSGATVYNFLLNRKVTFKASSHLVRSAVLFLLLFAANQLFSSATIVALGTLGMPSALAKVLTMCCITAWNFVLLRRVVFKP
ncbi:MAG: GtrA family protein [Coriobacteriales bacterium]|jgi:putative flippase GtrA|nr:GtrA family protein [Coriobacteriales bacterium]